MESVFGFAGRDYVLLASDANAVRSIVIYQTDHDKLLKITDRQVMAVAGEAGDTAQFAEYIEKNVHLYELRTGIPLSTHAVAHYTRNELSYALRRNPYHVNLLIGGFDENGPEMYYLDYLGSMHKMRTAAHGYAAYFLLSLFDRLYKNDLTLEEGIQLAARCVREVKKRFLINSPNFKFKVIDAKGVREVQVPSLPLDDLDADDFKSSL